MHVISYPVFFFVFFFWWGGGGGGGGADKKNISKCLLKSSPRMLSVKI